MNLLVNMMFGSHLYGTNTELSDRDYKWVYLPEVRDVILGTFQKNINTMTKKWWTSSEQKNSPEDIDTEIYAIHRFLELWFMGETVFLDMIHARDTIIQSTPEREFLYANRAKFYTSDMKSYLGYCKSQAAKYGVKWSRINDLSKVIDILFIYNPSEQLSVAIDRIEETEHIKKTTISWHLNWDNRFLNICGKDFQYSCRIEYVLPILQKIYQNYWSRAQQAANNEWIDRKAISHAFRAWLQLIEIYTTGDLKYPLAQADCLRDMKIGKLSFVEDRISEQLDELVTQCYTLAEKSNLPKTVNKEFWHDWLVWLYLSK